MKCPSCGGDTVRVPTSESDGCFLIIEESDGGGTETFALVEDNEGHQCEDCDLNFFVAKKWSSE